MMRRGNLVQTYGRHRQRVVNLDVWTPDNTDDNVFGSSDDNGSLLGFSTPTDNKTAAQQRRKGNGKENMKEMGRLRRRVKEKNYEEAPLSKTGKRKAPTRRRTPLCDASNLGVHESPAAKQQSRRCNKVVVDTSCHERSSQLNFSEFEKYSLILSDSVEGEAGDGNVRWTNTGSVTTSTPHMAPDGRMDAGSVVVPSGSFYRDSTSPLSMCRVELERLRVSDMSNITGSSGVNSVCSYRGDSPSMDAGMRPQDDAEGGNASTPYDVSCDLFDDVPPSQTQSRRSMYLLRSRQKSVTRCYANNNSLGDSMYKLRSLSPVSYASDNVFVEWAESCDKEEVPSSSESDVCEESLSDICEEEETETTERDVSMLSKTSCVSPLRVSHHSIKAALTPRKSVCQSMNARERVLAQCGQEDVWRFTDCITPTMMKTITKIGEGVYGEVFRTQRKGESVALKVIPIEGNFPVNDEPQKTFEEMLPEIVISKELSALRDNDVNRTENFVNVLGVYVVGGSYPTTLLKQWDLFHKKKGSENDRPDRYTDSQLFLVFEFADSGADLESFQFNSLDEAHSVLIQVTTALAIAEAELQFEHRDLHWGNVLVSRTDEATIDCCHSGTLLEMESSGVKVSIIDFTLSRLSQDGCHVFTDLSKDPTLFTGTGDYQFDVYRLMKEENGNDWMPHHPFTNVLWIHYLADKLIQCKAYATANENRSRHQAVLRQFRVFLRGALKYSSATALLEGDSFI